MPASFLAAESSLSIFAVTATRQRAEGRDRRLSGLDRRRAIAFVDTHNEVDVAPGVAATPCQRPGEEDGFNSLIDRELVDGPPEPFGTSVHLSFEDSDHPWNLRASDARRLQVLVQPLAS